MPPSKSRRSKDAAPPAAPPSSAAAPDAARDGAAARPASDASEAAGASAAALVAVVAFTWGESLLAFEWARQHLFAPAGASPLALTFPFFAVAAIAALVAVRARAARRGAVGGPLVQALGLASGVLAVLALALAAWLGPRVLAAQDDVRVLRAARQIEDLAGALAAHRAAAGRHPDASSVRELVIVLGPRLPDPPPSAVDPWGHALEYASLSEGRGYLLVSPGPDGLLETSLEDIARQPRSARTGDDLVMLDGTFLALGLSGFGDAPAPAGAP